MQGCDRQASLAKRRATMAERTPSISGQPLSVAALRLHIEEDIDCDY